MPFQPPQVTATLSMASATPLTYPSYPIVVAYSQAGLDATLLLPGGLESFRVRLREGFPTAFKPLGMPMEFPPPYQEAGYPVPGSGANQGTRFIIRLLDVPKNADVLVPHGLQLGTGALELRRVFHSDNSGAGGCLYQLCPEPPPPGTIGPVEISGGSGAVVYEVTNSFPPIFPLAVEQIDIPIAVCHGGSNPTGCKTLVPGSQLGKMRVAVSFAPVSTIMTSDPLAPEPRFWETGPASQVPR